MKSVVNILIFSLLSFYAECQLTGRVYDSDLEAVPGVKIVNASEGITVRSNLDGGFTINADVNDSLKFSYAFFDTVVIIVQENMFSEGVEVKMKYRTQEVEEVQVVEKRLAEFDVGFLPPIKGVRLNNGTNSIIKLAGLNGAKSKGNPREMYAKIPGLNIWENDGAGIQVDIGGRGLSPKRTANFNTRQNGYDISADALGYPESYYTPPIEALDNIEIVRGSAALQFGTQFGGLLNFVIRDPVEYSPLEFTSRNTVGAYGYFSTFNRISGTHKRSYYQAYHIYKRGDGYRENSKFFQHQAFAEFGYHLTENWKVGIEYTHMNYLARQPGGLTDTRFDEDPRQSIRDRNWFGVNWNLLAVTTDYELNNQGRFNLRAFGMVADRKSLGFLGKVTQTDLGGPREMIYSDFRNVGLELRYLKKYVVRAATEETSAIRGAMVIGGRLYRGETETNQGTASDGQAADFSFLNPDDLETSSFLYPSFNSALFVENILFIGDRWRINFGARMEHIESSSSGFYKRYSIHPINYDTLQIATVRDSNQVVRTVPLFGFGTAYKVSKRSTLYANFTQNYRAINFTDIRVNNPNVQVDTNIRDEYGFTAELGFRGLLKEYLLYDVAAFYIFYGDKIGLAPLPNSIRKQRTNIGDAQNYGVESLIEINWLKAFNDQSKWELSTFINASYIDANYITSLEPNYIGNKVEYVSSWMTRAGLTIGVSRWEVKFQYSYNSDQFSDASNAIEPSGDAVIGVVPSYYVFDFSGKFRFKKYVQLEFGINNFTNAQYFTRRATGYPGPGILPADGINPYLTVQFQLAR